MLALGEDTETAETAHQGLGLTLHLGCDTVLSEAQVDDGAQHTGQTGDDVGEEDDGDTVTDTLLIDLLSQPHDNGSTGAVGQDQNDTNDPHAPHLEILSGGEVAAVPGTVGHHVASLEVHGVTDSSDQSQDDGQNAGDSGQLLLAGLALLRPLLKLGDGDGEQLDHDGSRNVGRHGQSEQGSLCQSTAGEQVQPAQSAVGHEAALHEVGGDPRHGDAGAQTVQHNDHQGEEDLIFQLGNFPRVF